jgi:hypothetical protein
MYKGAAVPVPPQLKMGFEMTIKITNVFMQKSFN